MKKLFILAILLVTVGILTPHAYADTSCGGWFEPSCSSDVATVQSNIDKLETAVPLPQLQDSLERKNISKRLTLFSDPNKVSYIYFISYGRVMAFYTVKGKITSGSKRLTSPVAPIDGYGTLSTDSSSNGAAYLGQAPELDGTYGSSADYIYFWTTDGTYVQWNGDYMMADQPLQLSTPPELVRQVK